MCNFSVKLTWLQGRGNKRNTTLFDRYYSQNFKAITLKKITNHARVKQFKLMFQVILIFSDYILIKQIIVSFTLFFLRETDFQAILPGVSIGELGHE